jgi:hypothetical protein
MGIDRRRADDLEVIMPVASRPYQVTFFMRTVPSSCATLSA